MTAVLLYAWMASRVLQGKLIGTDATGVPVLDPGAGQVRKGTIWTYCGQREVCPYLIYDYQPTGDGEAVRQFLHGYEGYLQADAASVFDQLYWRVRFWKSLARPHPALLLQSASFGPRQKRCVRWPTSCSCIGWNANWRMLTRWSVALCGGSVRCRCWRSSRTGWTNWHRRRFPD